MDIVGVGYALLYFALLGLWLNAERRARVWRRRFDWLDQYIEDNER